jgi:uncharacterized protein (TIGR02284 family)
MNTPSLQRDPAMEETRKIPTLQNRMRFSAEETADADTVCHVLEDLIEITRDGEEGFSHAAQYANDRALRDEFHQFSRERGQIVADLQRLERSFGKRDVDYSGSVIGAFHRAWMDIRSVVMHREDQAILEEAERGEDAALEAYAKALNHQPSLPASAWSVIQALANKIQKAHDRVKALRDSGRYSRG